MERRTASRTVRGERKLPAAVRHELRRADAATQDAMWFAASVRLSGIARTNLIARAAARSSAEIEAQRLGRALGLRGVRSFAELKRFLREAVGAMRTSLMRVGVSFPAHNRMRWNARQCLYHDCARRLGVIDEFQCCVFERLDAWLEELGVACHASPAVEGCLMRTCGTCVRDYRFSFAPEPRRTPRRAPIRRPR